MNETTKGKYIDGDAAVGKNVTTGGDAIVRGHEQIDHDLKVKGTADIANLKRLILQGHDITSIITSIFDGDISIDDNSLLTAAAIVNLINKEIEKLANIYLRKDKKDTANEEITFKDGFVLGAAAFKKAVLSGALEKEYTENSLISAKAVLELIKNHMQLVADRYIRRDIDDSAIGLITFLKGLKAEGLASFLAGMAVEGLATFSGSLSSPDFWSGWTGQGWRLWFKDTVNIIGEATKKASLELDDLTVRGTFRVFEFVINQLRGENDNYVFSGMMKVDHIDEDLKIIYLDTNKGETYNPFRKDDILRCKRWQFGNNTAKQYDILVKEAHVGNIEEGEDRVDWIEYESLDIEVGEVEQGDVLCRLDNLTDPERKGIVTTTSIGEGAPYIDVLYGMMTAPMQSLKVRLGNLSGIVSELFGELTGYGLYSNNAYLTGEFYLSTGESVATKIRMLENLFSSSMTKTTHDIKEADNIVVNCSFVDNMANWQKDVDEDMDLFFLGDEPVMLDDDIYTDSRRTATMENVEGREILHLLNTGISQKNNIFVGRVPEDREVEVNVKYDADVLDDKGNVLHRKGDVKRYEEDVLDDKGNVLHRAGELIMTTEVIRPTLYITYRYMCRQGGTVQIGFTNGRTTTYSTAYDKIISVDELGTLTENVIAADGVWHERQYRGYYDRIGDFIIRTTGEIFIDALTVTSNPLDDYKTEIGTELRQTAEAIGMYGRNINNIEGNITSLGVEVNANKKEVELFVNERYKKDITEIDNRIKVNTEGISATAKTVESNVTRLGKLEVTSDNITAEVTHLRGGQVQLIHQQSASIACDKDSKAMVAGSYTIGVVMTFNEKQCPLKSLAVSTADESNKYLKVSGNSLVLSWTKGQTIPTKTLSFVATIDDPDGKKDTDGNVRTYRREGYISMSPAVKGEDGISPNTAYKSTVFKRSNTKPDTPSGGTYANPVPNGWSDGIPAGEEILWASTRILSSDGKSPQQNAWSDPKQMTDTADFDVEYSSLESPNDPTGHPNTNKQWSNTADTNTIWMATSTMKNGVWNKWEKSKIKGEKGEDGQGEVYSLVDLGSYATISAADLLTVYVAGMVVLHVDGASKNIENINSLFKLKIESNKTESNTENYSKTYSFSSKGNPFTFTEISQAAVSDTYLNNKNSYIVSLIANDDSVVSSFSIPVKLANGAAITIAENKIRAAVQDEKGQSKFEITKNEILQQVYTKNQVDSTVKTLSSQISQKQDKIDLSVYAKTQDLDTLKTNLSGMGISITEHKISINSIGDNPKAIFTVNTDNFKLSEDGTIDVDAGRIGNFAITDGGITCLTGEPIYENGHIVGSRPKIQLTSKGKLFASEAEIYGDIHATSGDFKNCRIERSCVIEGLLYRKSTIINNSNAAKYGEYNGTTVQNSTGYILDLAVTGFNVQLELVGVFAYVALPHSKEYEDAEIQIANFCKSANGSHIEIYVGSMRNGVNLNVADTIYYSSITTYKCVHFNNTYDWIPISKRNDDNSSINPLGNLE